MRQVATLAAMAITLSGCAGLFRTPTAEVLQTYGNTWARPYDSSGTLGAQLEDQFGFMLAGCGIHAIDHAKRSAVPLILQQSMRGELDGPVITYPGQSTWNMFRYVSETGDLSKLLAAAPN
jgi:hypothetical protein